MSVAVSIRRPSDGDLGFIRAILSDADLPTDDIAPGPVPGFRIAECDGVPAGVIGWEPHGDVALLRSLAVVPGARAGGIGRALVAHLEDVAVAAGVRRLTLLTQTARGFFEALGYAVVQRAEVPVALRETAQFRTLCPASATCMSKTLPTT